MLTRDLVIRRCLIIASIPGGLGGKKKDHHKCLLCTFLFQQWWRHYREPAILAELMAHRQAVSTSHCFNLRCSVLLRLLNSDSDYDNDSYHSLKLVVFLALS